DSGRVRRRRRRQPQLAARGRHRGRRLPDRRRSSDLLRAVRRAARPSARYVPALLPQRPHAAHSPDPALLGAVHAAGGHRLGHRLALAGRLADRRPDAPGPGPRLQRAPDAALDRALLQLRLSSGPPFRRGPPARQRLAAARGPEVLASVLSCAGYAERRARLDGRSCESSSSRMKTLSARSSETSSPRYATTLWE